MTSLESGEVPIEALTSAIEEIYAHSKRAAVSPFSKSTPSGLALSHGGGTRLIKTALLRRQHWDVGARCPRGTGRVDSSKYSTRR